MTAFSCTKPFEDSLSWCIIYSCNPLVYVNACIMHNSIPKYADVTKELNPGYYISGKSLLFLPCKSQIHIIFSVIFKRYLDVFFNIYLFYLFCVRGMGMNSCMCVVVRRELVGAGALFSPDPGITFRLSGWVASSLTNAPILHCPQMFSPIFLHLFVTICITFLLSHSSYSSVQPGIIFYILWFLAFWTRTRK